MPIVTNDENQQNNEEEPVKDPVAVDDEYQGIAVDAGKHDIESLLVHIEGSPWTVTYFSQMLDGDSQANALQLDLAPAYQQYTRINQFELKVNDPLDQEMNEDTGSMTVTGGATIYPFVIPNQGDMFIADIGNGKDGLFTIKSVQRMTIMRETCHEVTYEMVNEITDVYREDLASKTIKTVHFKKDFLVKGQNPMLITDEANLVERIEEHQKKLVSRYLNMFFNREYRTLLVPEKNKTTYDHFLVRSFKKVFDYNDHPLLREVDTMNCDGDDAMHNYTIWDCLLNMDNMLFPMVQRKMKSVYTDYFVHLSVFRGIAFSGIEKMVYPDEPPTQDTVPLLDDGDADTPLIHPLDVDEYYVFSEAFYEDLTNPSTLEIETLKAINGEALNHTKLDELATQSIEWGKLEQFYYLPVLLILLKVSLRRL